jgi:hypothetical protein
MKFIATDTIHKLGKRNLTIIWYHFDISFQENLHQMPSHVCECTHMLTLYVCSCTKYCIHCHIVFSVSAFAGAIRLQGRSCHVNEVLWMEVVWSWANHIQAILSQSPILRSINLLGQLVKNLWHMKLWWMTNQRSQDEGIDCSSHRMRTFVWDFEGYHRVP